MFVQFISLTLMHNICILVHMRTTLKLHMRTTLNLDEELINKASGLTGITR